MEFGNLINLVDSKVKDKLPVVGDGVTVLLWSDRHAGTITRVSSSGKTFWYRQDDAKRVDSNGMSESQEYSYSPNPNNPEVKCQCRRRDKNWRDENGHVVKVGYREEYYDYSF